MRIIRVSHGGCQKWLSQPRNQTVKLHVNAAGGCQSERELATQGRGDVNGCSSSWKASGTHVSCSYCSTLAVGSCFGWTSPEREMGSAAIL
eukprot:233836-Chlamydomonas_euryale.AAC.2